MIPPVSQATCRPSPEFSFPLSDSDATSAVKIVPAGESAHKITRADLAQFLVDQLESEAYLHQAVTVENS